MPGIAREIVSVEEQWDWLELPDPPAGWGAAPTPICGSAPWLTAAAGGPCYLAVFASYVADSKLTR